MTISNYDQSATTSQANQKLGPAESGGGLGAQGQSPMLGGLLSVKGLSARRRKARNRSQV